MNDSFMWPYNLFFSSFKSFYCFLVIEGTVSVQLMLRSFELPWLMLLRISSFLQQTLWHSLRLHQWSVIYASRCFGYTIVWSVLASTLFSIPLILFLLAFLKLSYEGSKHKKSPSQINH